MRNKVLTACLLVLLAVNARAINGHTEMVIIEGDGYEFDVAENDQTEAIAKKTQEYLENRGIPVNGNVELNNPLLTATEESVRRVDITYTYPKDVAGKDGKILRKAGDTFNPLTKVTMPDLIVVSGKSETQLAWAERFKEENLSPSAMIVLADGNWKTVRKELGIEAYRLSDRLQQRLQLTHVPCTVSQDGEEIVIHEYSAEDLD